jgi:hypothetical protein
LIWNIDAFLLHAATKNNKYLHRLNIFDATALAMGKPKEYGSEVRKIWGKNYVSFSEEPKFTAKFGLKLKIWILNTDKSGDNSSSLLLYGNFDLNYSVNIAVTSKWSVGSETITTEDDISYISDTKILNFHPCQDENCDFVAKNEEKLKKHHAAHAADRIKCDQSQIGDKVFLFDEMKQDGIIPGSFHHTLALYWDIESLLIKQNGSLVHVPISIAAYRNFGNKQKFFYYRKNMEPYALREMIKEFLDLLEDSFKLYTDLLPDSILENKKKIFFLLLDHKNGKKKLAPNEFAKFTKYMNLLREISCLKIYSFCGERYDVPVLKGMLFDELYNRDENFRVLKRGSGIMQFQFKNIIARDAANFLQPTSLKKFAAAFGIDQIEKDIWPYTHYKTLAQIKDDKDFPPINVFCHTACGDKIGNFEDVAIDLYLWKDTGNFMECLDFFGLPSSEFTEEELSCICTPPRERLFHLESSLKIDPEIYVRAKRKFRNKIKSGEWTCMLDQLRYYNELDCELLGKAWEKYTKHFYEEFHVDVFMHMSLAQLSESTLFRHYPKNCLPMFSFSETFTWLNKEIRANNFGGLSACFDRLCLTNNNHNFPKSVSETPNGSSIHRITQLGELNTYPYVNK